MKNGETAPDPLSPALQLAISIIQSSGGRVTALELKVKMGIGLSTAYTYLKELFVKDWVERVKIQGSNGTSRQFLYIIKYPGCTTSGDHVQSAAYSEHFVSGDVAPVCTPGATDPIDDVLEILSHLAKKVRMLEMQVVAMEQDKLKHYPLLSALKKNIETSQEFNAFPSRRDT